MGRPVGTEQYRAKEARAEREVRVKEIHAIVAALGAGWEGSTSNGPFPIPMTATLTPDTALKMVNKLAALVEAIPEP